jgi:hypothetical protein
MAKKRIPDLKIEAVNSPNNHMFLSLVEYKRETYLCLLDNIKSSEIGAYVLDYSGQSGIDVVEFLELATRWFYSKSEEYPLSVELARQGKTEWASGMYRTFDTTYVSRIVGHGFAYDKMEKSKVRRRRVVALPAGIEVRLKKDGRKLEPGQLIPEESA